MRQRSIKDLRKGIALLPNFLTTLNLFCGFYSITRALRGDFEYAVWLIVLATLFDFLDGRVARMTNSESDFGTEYDSLADLCTFCLAPAILIYEWGLIHLSKFGVAACFLYFICGALRLARYNVQSGSIEKKDFQGLPTPAAGATLALSVLFYQTLFDMPVLSKDVLHPVMIFHSLLAVFLGLLMVSNVRYKSLKRANRKTSFIHLVGIVALIFVIAIKPEVTLFVLGIIYTSYGLVSWLVKGPKTRSSFFGRVFKKLYSDHDPNPVKKRRRRRKPSQPSESENHENVVQFEQRSLLDSDQKN